MAHGYEDTPHANYAEWKLNTEGKDYDIDGYYGCQCWDYASLFWRNVGFGVGYPRTGTNHYASECWTENKELNAGDQFDLIYDKTQILQGDIIVMDGVPSNPAGHITFANEDYNGTNYLSCLGQNQNGHAYVSVDRLGLGDFLGAFRYKAWHTPPEPSFTGRSHFKWVLYARKFRNRYK